MKQEDVKVGATYLTKIGTRWERVVVMQKREAIPAYTTASGYQHRAERCTFDVRRENEERVLPKPRSAAALQAI